MLANLVASHGMSVYNQCTSPTYSRVNAESIVDVTFARLNTGGSIRDWKVLSEIGSESDHFYLSYTISPVLPFAPKRPLRSRGWSFKKLNLPKLTDGLNNHPLELPFELDVEGKADAVKVLMEGVCDGCMPRRSVLQGRREAHCWSTEIATLKKASCAARRAYQRAGRRSFDPGLELKPEAMVSARRNLRADIKKAQADSWAQLCSAVDQDPWGLPYRVITKRLVRRVRIEPERGKVAGSGPVPVCPDSRLGRLAHSRWT